MSVTINGTSGVVFNDSSTQNTAATGFGFKNRIINGAMVIDQRNAGAAITPTNGQFSVDRWACLVSQASKYTAQQNAGSVTPPTGYIKYLGITSSSAYSVLTGDYFNIRQGIEGLNVADLAWGTASAATITLSFWVRSSLTGTFGGGIVNGAGDRSYPYTYTISVANTWEQKTITIAGDTTGTWVTTNSNWGYIQFGLGVGTTYSGTAGAWAAGNFLSATGATSVVGTNGATFYITGVQLEKGSTATSFDYRPYGTEFQLCQRYYEQWNVAASFYLANGLSYSTGGCRTVLQYQVPKRSATTATFSGSIQFSTTAISKTITSFSFDGASVNNVLMYNDAQTGLTTGQAMQIQVPGGGSATLTFSAEL